MAGGVAHGAPVGHHGADAPNTISIPWVIGASLLMGIGLFLISVWIVTFNILYFGGVFVVVVGALMVISPRMGSDHA